MFVPSSKLSFVICFFLNTKQHESESFSFSSWSKPMILYVHWHYCQCGKQFSQYCHFFSMWIFIILLKYYLKKRLLCIIKLNKRKRKQRFRAQKHVRIIQLLELVIFFYYFLLFAAIWWTAIQCSRFDIFQLYSACVFYYIIFLHTIAIQLRTIWPVRDCINLHNNKFYEFSYD